MKNMRCKKPADFKCGDCVHVDIILTGDKDFLILDMEHPKCMMVTQFFENEDVDE